MTTSAFFLSIFLLASPVEARLIDRTAALVNGDMILRSDVQHFQKNFALRRDLDSFITLTGFSPDSDKKILDYLVQEKLIVTKYPATEEEIEEEINGIQKSNGIDREHIKRVLQSQGGEI